jgi:hypothetical protein
MMVSSHPAQAAAKLRLSDRVGLLDGFQSSLFAMDAEKGSETTIDVFSDLLRASFPCRASCEWNMRGVANCNSLRRYKGEMTNGIFLI